MFDAAIFKAYDVRGIYPTQINEEVAYLVGRAFVQILHAHKVAIGIDMRASSQSLYNSLAKGITDQGANVYFIGMVPTPVLNFAVAHYDMDGGIMISASHNPGQYNAFKLIQKPALQMGERTGMSDIKRSVLQNDFPYIEEKGNIAPKDVIDEYLDHVRSFATFSGLSLVVDYGNGVGAITGKPLLDQTPCNVFSMFEEPDGTFPNHPANPHEEKNFQTLKEQVRRKKADLGIFFDGDADRAIFVDERGEIIPPDFSLCLQALDILKDHPHEKIYYDLRFSKIVKEKIEAAGGIAVVEKVGNPIYKEKLIKEGGVLGGEFSGHVMYKDNYAIDDGLFSTVRFLNILSNAKLAGKTASDLIKPLRKYVQTPEINIQVTSNEQRNQKINAIKQHYESKYTLKFLDGITVEAENFWFNIRGSNTEPIIRIRIEADTKEILQTVKKQILSFVQ